MDRNYSITRVYETLLSLGKVRHKRDFSRFYLGRKCGYFTMITTGNSRQISIGALRYLIKRLKYEVSCEADKSAKAILNECLKLAHSELEIRLDLIAWSAPLTS